MGSIVGFERSEMGFFSAIPPARQDLVADESCNEEDYVLEDYLPPFCPVINSAFAGTILSSNPLYKWESAVILPPNRTGWSPCHPSTVVFLIDFVEPVSHFAA